MHMPISGTRILAFIALIAEIAQGLLTLGDPQVNLYAKWTLIITIALTAGVNAAIQFGVLPQLAELARLKARKRK